MLGMLGGVPAAQPVPAQAPWQREAASARLCCRDSGICNGYREMGGDTLLPTLPTATWPAEFTPPQHSVPAVNTVPGCTAWALLRLDLVPVCTEVLGGYLLFFWTSFVHEWGSQISTAWGGAACSRSWHRAVCVPSQPTLALGPLQCSCLGQWGHSAWRGRWGGSCHSALPGCGLGMDAPRPPQGRHLGLGAGAKQWDKGVANPAQFPLPGSRAAPGLCQPTCLPAGDPEMLPQPRWWPSRPCSSWLVAGVH